MMFGYGGTGGWPVWAVALMWIGMLAFLGVLLWVGYAMTTNSTRWSRRPRQAGHGAHERRSGADARRSGADARVILQERLARGEIDAAEYQRLRALIAAGDNQAPAGSASRQ